MKTNARFTFDKVRHDQENELHLVVTVQAPKKDWEKKRPPVCVFPVVDVSTSMSGDKLGYAKKSALKLVEHLQDGDYAGLAIFHDGVELISAPMEMTQENKSQLRQRIGDLHVQGCTNFSGGMLMGLEQLNGADVPKDLLLRVIMLTDGHANRGVATKHNELVKLLEENIGRATLSCFGYGTGADQELLSDLAKVGKGNYAFIENPDDALSAFAKELGGLLSTYAQSLEVVVTTNNGHEISEVLSDVDVEGADKKAVITVPEILSEEEMHFVLAVKLSEQSKALPRKMTAFDISVAYDFVTESGKLEKRSDTLKAKISFVKPGKEQSKPNTEVDKIVAFNQAIQAQIEAERLADAGNYADAVLHMQHTSDSFGARGLVDYQMFSAKVGGMMTNKAAYAKGADYRTSTKSLRRRAGGTSAANSEALADVACFVGATATPAQDKMMENFKEPEKNRVNVDITVDPQPAIIPTVITGPNITITPPVTTPQKPESKVEKKSISKSRSKRW